MKKKYFFKKMTFLLCLTTGVVYSQTGEKVFSNKGNIKIEEGTEVYIYLDVYNEQGDYISKDKYIGLENDGTMYLFNNLTNNGLFGYDQKDKGGTVIFDKETGKVVLAGSEQTSFNNVVFNSKEGIDLQNEISIYGKSVFQRGHVVVNAPLQGAMTYFDGAVIEGVGNDSHVVGTVDRQGKEDRMFPVGNGEYYRPIELRASKTVNDMFNVQYVSENPLTTRPHNILRSPIVEVDNTEYWEVKNSATDANVILSLSWSEGTTPRAFHKDKVEGQSVHVLRWDETEKVWVDEGGMIEGENFVTTPLEVNAKGIFTLGLVDEAYSDEVKIWNAVTPNGDGQNDYFLVENINKFPNNSVEIVNRWGSKVFSATGYDRKGDGSENVFIGEADGKGVINKGKKLPSGTYYYIVKYEYTDANGSRWIKKAGYLNLENN